jgi:single-stranded-DNA-specific exonuclease
MESIDPDIVGELLFRDITFSLTSMIQRFEPYGQENPLPKFISKRVKIVQATPIGSEKNHLRFLLEQDGVIHQAIQFKTEESYEPDTLADIIYTVNENHFRGNTTLQLMIDRIEPLLPS